MKRALMGMVCAFLLSGCAVYDYFFPEAEKTPSAAEVKKTPPKRAPKRAQKPQAKPAPNTETQRTQADTLLREAKTQWSESTEAADPRSALGLLNQVLHMEPENTEALHYRALAYRQLRYYDGAENDATKAVSLETSAENYATRSLVYASSGNWLGAEKDARRALVIDEALPIVLVAMAGVSFHNNDPQAGCRYLERACDQGECGPWRRAAEGGQCQQGRIAP